MKEEQVEEIKQFLEQTPITVEHLESGITFDIEVTVHAGADSAKVRIANYHTNIVRIEKNGEILENIPVSGEEENNLTDRSLLDMEHIWEFINTVDVEDVKPILEPQLRMNMAIAEEGMTNDYGANIGKVIWKTQEHTTANHARAMAAAGSDARMNGCEMPVVTIQEAVIRVSPHLCRLLSLQENWVYPKRRCTVPWHCPT